MYNRASIALWLNNDNSNSLVMKYRMTEPTMRNEQYALCMRKPSIPSYTGCAHDPSDWIQYGGVLSAVSHFPHKSVYRHACTKHKEPGKCEVQRSLKRFVSSSALLLSCHLELRRNLHVRNICGALWQTIPGSVLKTWRKSRNPEHNLSSESKFTEPKHVCQPLRKGWQRMHAWPTIMPVFRFSQLLLFGLSNEDREAGEGHTS